MGKSSCEAERRADAAITDGLNSKSLIPTKKNTMSLLSYLSLIQKNVCFSSLFCSSDIYHFEL